MTLGKLKSIPARVFALGFGLCWFTVFLTQAIIRTYFTRQPSKKFWEYLSIERRDIWNLSLSRGGLSHAFHVRENGQKIHYVTSTPHARRNLVIFIHGWPDSNVLWRGAIDILKTLAIPDTAFVALDLPGHGGSDGLPNYGATEVMESLSEFVLAMRAKYYISSHNPGQKATGGNCIIVGHDWGTILGCRLAAEAPILADRFVLINAGPAPLAQKNIERRLEFTKKMIHTWLRQPTSLHLLRSAALTFYPILVQIICSYYVFIMNLPKFLVEMYGTYFGLFTLRVIQSLSVGYDREEDNAMVAGRIASTIGPDQVAINSKTANGESYGTSTAERSMRGNFFETVRLYREGLVTGSWQQSPKTVEALQELVKQRRKPSAGKSDREQGPEAVFRAPATVIWGEMDPVLDSRLIVRGITDYFTHDSQLILLPSIGHWVPIEAEGPRIVAETIAWAVTGGSGDIGERIRRIYPMVRVPESKERPLKSGESPKKEHCFEVRTLDLRGDVRP